ncbi:arylsulfatase [Arenibacter sp. BSSL-BM3]|uniref:Arylsulfatase n=1 Tax=Arenibacter arenosicollis TaxID=2762274 RepID=A0ABR7QN00_9FLAO|nr:arylsulfatase [Arenibacter arenosicollis]MBC8768409.1 arylsulfatase [Arenibacter arenosicollis]
MKRLKTVRKKIPLLFFIPLFTFLGSAQDTVKKVRDNQRPNIIYILADDLGYGDLSCFGQKKFSTPNIDKPAEQGMIFTQHYSGSTVCAPSRSALMTGQHTGHTPIRGNKKVPLPSESITVAEILKEKGYTTGAFGKWGMGLVGSQGDPLSQGFDHFYGYNNQSLAHNYYPYFLWDDEEKIILEGNKDKATGDYAPNLIHKKALDFIDENKDVPFFLYYPSIMPHAELVAPSSYMDKYKGTLEPEKPYKGVDEGPKYRKGPYGSQEFPHAAFVAMINILDDQVGEIIEKIERLGLTDNTIIIFTSDNGPHQEGGADPDYFDSNSIYRGYKRDLYEGGIRVPMIASWPNKIERNTKSDHISAFWDVLPTIADLLDIKVESEIDGISFLPTLLGKKDQKEHDYLYWEFHERGGRQALLAGNWKLIRYNVNEAGDYELYNLEEDPSETRNVIKDYPKKANDLIEELNKSRTPSKEFQFK